MDRKSHKEQGDTNYSKSLDYKHAMATRFARRSIRLDFISMLEPIAKLGIMK